jgi:predicted phosphohydrolase
MRLVVASDTHEQHAGLDVPDGDAFIHAGDLTFRGDLRAIRAFGAWVQALPHKHKIIIAGNHDWAFEREPASARVAIGDGTQGVMYLQDSGVTIDGVSFWGSPWQPWFLDWAFNLRRGSAIAAKWALIPANTDVLITHGPPMDILDSNGKENLGCADLTRRLGEIRPRAHIFGHIHEGSGVLVQAGTTYVNASICDAAYKPTNPVRVIDV